MIDMLTTSVIDQIQSTKKQIINCFVTHKDINEALNNFVDAQTEYTKKAVDAGYKTAASVGYSLYTELFNLVKVK